MGLQPLPCWQAVVGPLCKQELWGEPRFGLLWLVILVGIALAALAGCGFSGSAAAVQTPVALRGAVRGGQHGVSGASMQLYAAGSSGVASAAQPLLTSAVQSDSGGNFEIPASYSCPSPSSQVYLVARGGNPGLASGTNNAAIALMALLGSCNSLSPAAAVVVNEATTVGSIWPLAAYMTSATNLGSASGDSTFAAAASSVNEFVNIQAGSSPGAGTAESYFAQNSKLYSLADVLDACVNSAGGSAGDGSSCGSLFSMATPASGGAPTDTISAAMRIAQSPDNEVAAIYGLVGGPAFQPTLTAAPPDWTLALTYPLATPPTTSVSQLVFLQQPSDATTGAVLAPAVTVGVEDGSGNLITSATNLVKVNLTGVSGLEGTVDVAAHAGVATFSNLAVGTSGGYTLTVSSPGLRSATSESFDISTAATSSGTLPTATYYVSNAGSDTNNGTSPATPWKTLTRLSSTKMLPGNSASLQCGSVFRETLTLSQSGTATAPISYGSYGSCSASNLPLISGADQLSTWSAQPEGAYTAYYAMEATAPAVVFEDNHRLTKTNTQTAMPIGSFFYDSVHQRVYVRTKQDAAPGSHLMEASVRADGVVLGGVSYVNLSGIEADKAAQNGILAWGTLTNVNLTGTVTNYSYGNGIWFTANTGQSQNNVLIQNCVANYNGENGIMKGNFGNNFVVDRCTTNYNAFDPQYTYTAGIRFISDGTTDANRATNSGARNNIAAFNGVTPDTNLPQTSDAGQEGMGVWCDTCGRGSFLTGNIAHDNAKNGVMLEFTGAVGSLSMTGNIAYRNASAGILHSRRSHNDVVSNNTSYDNLINCQFSGEYGGGETTVGMVNNIYENNICSSLVLRAYGVVFVAEWGAENNALGEGSGNIFRNNSFGPPAATNGTFAQFGAGKSVTSYATLNALYGASMKSVEGDPMLVSPSTANFGLMPGSPCIKAGYGGVDLGAVPYTTAP